MKIKAVVLLTLFFLTITTSALADDTSYSNLVKALDIIDNDRATCLGAIKRTKLTKRDCTLGAINRFDSILDDYMKIIFENTPGNDDLHSKLNEHKTLWKKIRNEINKIPNSEWDSATIKNMSADDAYYQLAKKRFEFLLELAKYTSIKSN
jgi:hypothetical protein